MKFDINNYKGKYVMHCKTEEEAQNFCDYLHSVGREWRCGDSYKSRTCYSWYQEETAYNFNDGGYCDVQHYRNEDYTILEWEDFMKHTFTKADLTTGDVIKFRNDAIGIFIADGGVAITTGGYIDMRYINNDMTNGLMNNEFDVVAVRRPNEKGDCQFAAFKYKFGTIVYEREESEEMTLTEVCKLLGKNIKIIQ